MELLKEIIDLIHQVSADPAFIRALQVSGAVLAALVVSQGIKWCIKAVWPPTWHGKIRTLALALISVYMGYRAGVYFVTGESTRQWAVVIALTSPFIYFALVQYARVKNKIILLSVLKMRPVIEEKGTWKLHDTQTFMVKK